MSIRRDAIETAYDARFAPMLQPANARRDVGVAL